MKVVTYLCFDVNLITLESVGRMTRINKVTNKTKKESLREWIYKESLCKGLEKKMKHIETQSHVFSYLTKITF